MKEIIEKIEKGFIETANEFILNPSKVDPKQLVLNRYQFWGIIKETLIKEE